MASGDEKKLFFYPSKSNALIFLLNGRMVITDPRNTDTFFVQDITNYIEHYQNIFLSNINHDSPKNSLGFFLSAILTLLMNTNNAMIEFIKSLQNQESNSENTSYSFNTPLITDKHEVILVFSKSLSKESTKIDKILIEILNYCLNYCKQKTGEVNKLIVSFVDELTNLITTQFDNQQNKSIDYKYKPILKFFTEFEQSLKGFTQDFNEKHSISISSDLNFTPNFYWFDLFFFIHCIYCKDRSFIELSNPIFMIDDILKFPDYKENSSDLKLLLQDIISAKIEQIPTQDKLSHFDYFIKELSRTIFNFTFYEQLNVDLRNEYLIRDLQKLDDCSYQFAYGHKCFYIQLLYRKSQNQASVLNCDSKFILQSDNSKRNNISNQYFFSFMPIGNLEKFIKDKSNQLANFNKFVIVLEIAMALEKLHSEGQFCGNLSLNSIFINSQLDAYICSTKGSVNNDIDAFISIFSELFNDSNDDDIKEIIGSSSNLTITQIINKIKRLKFYIDNSEYIDYRTTNSIDYRKQTCTFSDLFESYFRFPDVFKNDVSQLLNQFLPFNNNICSTVARTLDNMQNFTYLSTLLQRLQYHFYDNMNPKITNFGNIDNLWLKLINYKKFKNTNEILDTLHLIFNFYKEDENKKKQIKNAIKEFINKFFDEITVSDSNMRNKLISIFNEILGHRTLFYLKPLFPILIKNLLSKTVYSHRLEDIEHISISNNVDNISIERRKTLHFDSVYNFLLGYSINNSEENSREIRIFSNPKISKFIPKIVGKSQTEYFIPFFPIGSLKNLINNNQISQKMKFEFNYVDRVVIILQILNGISDLHKNKEFHGNLCDQAIFINSNCDAYIGWIGYDIDDGLLSKNYGPRFYRSVKSYERYENKIKGVKLEGVKLEGVKLEDAILDDIFSCGILIFEILADKTPYDIIHEKTTVRDEIINEIIKKSTLNFLLESKYSENISPEFIEVIKKCENGFKSIDEMIDCIKNLDFYKKNEIEIDYRVNNAIDYCNNGCELSDLVQCCLLGFEFNQTHIKNMLNGVNYERKFEFEFTSKCRINEIYDFLDLKSKQRKIEMFNESFSLIIQSNFIEKEIKSINCFNLSNRFHLSTIEINTKYIPIPFCSMDVFIKNNQNLLDRFWYLWLYVIAKEIKQIHSIYLWHGDLSLKSIGIYYNRKLQMFIPSFICYYPIYMKCNINNQLNMNESLQTNLAKFQSKVIKKFYKIVKEIRKDLYYIEENEMSLDEIIFDMNSESRLNNLSDEQKKDFKCYKNYEQINGYSDFKVNYNDIKQLCTINNCINSFNGSFINFHSLEI